MKIQNHLAVLPVGDFLNEGAVNWTTADLEPYLFYKPRGRKRKMFGGLIFNPISVRDNHYIYPLYASFGDLPDKVDWQLFIDLLFQPGVNLHAIAEAPRRTDIWIVIPYPIPFQDNFGQIKGRDLNFATGKDRLLAIKWWLTKFLSRWKQERAIYPNLKLRGFVWQRETIFQQDVLLVEQVNRFIKARGLYCMWLPNYGTGKIVDWRALGFDLVCVNPNYYGNTNHDFNWITNAAAFAQLYKTGLQINYGKGIIFNDTHLLDYLNLGLPQYNNYINNRILVFQFHNQRLADVCVNEPHYYKNIYGFIKGKYTKVNYPKIKY